VFRVQTTTVDGRRQSRRRRPSVARMPGVDVSGPNRPRQVPPGIVPRDEEPLRESRCRNVSENPWKNTAKIQSGQVPALYRLPFREPSYFEQWFILN
jgi:hypothetical protein